MIRLENVSYIYAAGGSESVRGLNLHIREGEFVVLTGESGCGKTTITRLINGLAPQFYEGTMTGRVLIGGKDLAELPLWEIGKQVGSIFQDPRSQFFASITEDEIAFGCENYGFPLEKIRERTRDAVDRINGTMLLGKSLHTMSSGEKQKVAIASVYAVNPPVIVFDEPSANLDMHSVTHLRELMRFLKESGHTVVVAEHRLYYLTGLADRFLCLRDGDIHAEYATADFVALPEQNHREMGLRATDLWRLTGKAPAIERAVQPAVQIDGLGFRYGKNTVFDGFSAEFHPGEVVALIGHNGVGKSTLSELLTGLRKEKSGAILYGGQTLSRRGRRKAAYFVMQNTDSQLFGESVEDELLLHTPDGSKITRILERYGLEPLRDRHPSTLSGGQKQRLTLAVADCMDADILILDEPTSGLDRRNMERIAANLKALAAAGKTILVITHDYEFAVDACSRAVRLVDARHHEDFAIPGNEAMLLSCMEHPQEEMEERKSEQKATIRNIADAGLRGEI